MSKNKKKLPRKPIIKYFAVLTVAAMSLSFGMLSVNAAAQSEVQNDEPTNSVENTDGISYQSANIDVTANDVSVVSETSNDNAVHEPLNADNSWLTRYECFVSENVSAYAVFTGGTEPYNYKYCYRIDNGEWVTVKDYSPSKRTTVTMPSTAGDITVRISCIDGDGCYQSKYMHVLVKNKTNEPFEDNGSSLSTAATWANWTIRANAEFKGGTQPYKYKYSYRLNNGEWVITQNYTSNKNVGVKMPDKAGNYTVRISSLDSDGSYQSKYLSVKVRKDTKTAFTDKSSSLSTSATWAKWTITANADFSGGVEPYTYKYSYRLGNGSWVTAQDYTTSASAKITMPDKAGNYTVRISSKDGIGTYTSKYLTLKVKKDTKTAFKENGSYTSINSIFTNGGVTAYAKFTGGVAPYTYKYSYRIKGGNWVDATGFETSSNKWIKMPSKAGTYTLRIAGYDSAGHYNSKYITINVKNSINKKIYISPSNQDGNMYAYGNTSEMIQCNRIADATKIALERCGFTVKKAPANQSMYTTVAESNSWNADLHLCIHTNAGGGNGTMCMVYSKNDGSMKYAVPIYNAVQAVTPGTYDYGIKEYPQLVELNSTSAMAVYTEVDFHDNPSIAKWIIEHPTEIGEAFAKGVCEAYGVTYIPAD